MSNLRMVIKVPESVMAELNRLGDIAKAAGICDGFQVVASAVVTQLMDGLGPEGADAWLTAMVAACTVARAANAAAAAGQG